MGWYNEYLADLAEIERQKDKNAWAALKFLFFDIPYWLVSLVFYLNLSFRYTLWVALLAIPAFLIRRMIPLKRKWGPFVIVVVWLVSLVYLFAPYYIDGFREGFYRLFNFL